MSTLPRMLTKRPRYRLVAVSVTVLAALVSAGCGSRAAATASSSPAEKHNLVIATVPTASSAGLYVAQREGFFHQAGLNVKIGRASCRERVLLGV